MENTEMKKIIDRQRNFFQTGMTLDVSFRIAALKRLQHMIRRHEKEIEAAPVSYTHLTLPTKRKA